MPHTTEYRQLEEWPTLTVTVSQRKKCASCDATVQRHVNLRLQFHTQRTCDDEKIN